MAIVVLCFIVQKVRLIEGNSTLNISTNTLKQMYTFALVCGVKLWDSLENDFKVNINFFQFIKI